MTDQEHARAVAEATKALNAAMLDARKAGIKAKAEIVDASSMEYGEAEIVTVTLTRQIKP